MTIFCQGKCHINPYITCYKICNKLHRFQASMDMTQHAEMFIPLNDVNGLLINVSTFNKPRSVDNVQSEPCPCARAHHWSQTLRLNSTTSNNRTTHKLLWQKPNQKLRTCRSKTWKALTEATLSPTMELTVDDFPTPPFPITRIVNVLTSFTSQTQAEHELITNS
jgi:hypothetical protein